MKFRTSFVTNSSSSSYVCEICGRSESGYDLSLSKCDMYECVNGHVFCCDEALEKPTKEEMIKIILENEYNKEVWDGGIRDYREFTEEEISTMDEYDIFETFITEDSCYAVPECMCPICQFIEYSEYDLSAYLLKEYGIPRAIVFEEVTQFDKRRKNLYEIEYITYVCKKFNLNPAEVVASWKEKFGTYHKFREYLRS